MTGDAVLALAMAAATLVYLLYTLLRPEKF